MIPDRGNPFEQAVRRACDHANAGPDLDGMTYEEARMAMAMWGMSARTEADPFALPKCPDCGETVLSVLDVSGWTDPPS